jgi:hypothetical protein
VTAAVHIAGVKATPRELRPVIKAWAGLGWWMRAPLLWLCACALAAAVVMFLVPMPETVTIWMGGLWLAALYGLIGLGLLLHRKGQAMARRTPMGALSFDWRLDDAGLTFSTPISENRLAWEAVTAIREEKHRIVFAVTPYANHILPRRALNEDQARDLAVLIAEVRASGRLGRGAGG